MIADRDYLVALVARLMAGAYTNEAELEKDMVEFAKAVPHPRASDLIYHWEAEFSHAPTAEEVVERALSYGPLQL